MLAIYHYLLNMLLVGTNALATSHHNLRPMNSLLFWASVRSRGPNAYNITNNSNNNEKSRHLPSDSLRSPYRCTVKTSDGCLSIHSPSIHAYPLETLPLYRSHPGEHHQPTTRCKAVTPHLYTYVGRWATTSI